MFKNRRSEGVRVRAWIAGRLGDLGQRLAIG
jgi:hypothetical protein